MYHNIYEELQDKHEREGAVPTKTLINMSVQDVPGGAQFKEMIKKEDYLKDVVILVYDIGDRDSFRNLHYWIKEIRF